MKYDINKSYITLPGAKEIDPDAVIVFKFHYKEKNPMRTFTTVIMYIAISLFVFGCSLASYDIYTHNYWSAVSNIMCSFSNAGSAWACFYCNKILKTLQIPKK